MADIFYVQDIMMEGNSCTHSQGWTSGSVMDGIFSIPVLEVLPERNFRPHVNCVRPTPDNKYLCAVDNGIDQIKVISYQ